MNISVRGDRAGLAQGRELFFFQTESSRWSFTETQTREDPDHHIHGSETFVWLDVKSSKLIVTVCVWMSPKGLMQSRWVDFAEVAESRICDGFTAHAGVTGVSATPTLGQAACIQHKG